MKLGATGEYPHGKLGPHDEGALRIAVSHDDKSNVHINFGKKIRWFALPANDAITLAQLILHHAGIKRAEAGEE